MAWSDAARAAAAAARRARAHGRSRTVTIPGVHGFYGSFAVGRRQYAKHLKAIRKTVTVGGPKDVHYFRTKNMASRAAAYSELAIKTRRLVPKFKR